MKLGFRQIGRYAKKMRKFRLLATGLAIAIVTVIILLTRTRGTPVETANVKVSSITSEIVASGKVESQTSSTLMFPAAGKIAAVYIEEGQYVAKGQAIASLEAEPFLVVLRQASQDVNAADAVLSQVYDEQKKQTAAENFDQKIRRTNAETAKNKAYDTMRKAQFDLEHSTIYSPQDGVITEVNFMAGQQIVAGLEFGEVNDLLNLEFTAEVDETDIGRLKVGQIAKITLDAFDDSRADATVDNIADTATITTTGATAFKVKFTLPSDQKYKIGMNGEASIIIAQNKEALSVPLEAVIDQKYVYVKQEKTYAKKEVVLGIESDMEAEIISGLDEGQTVVISGFDQIEKKP